uniref:Glutamine amidotransferase class 1 domain containing 3 n=1 Tax=Sus scrofa TaxID=9823 RepID=A0A8D1XEC0_PIG
MAAFRVLVASRLAATPAFAPRPGLRLLPLGGWAPSPRAALHASAPRPGARVALVLSGCGVYDGTELHEASAILVHLSRGGAKVQIFAPDVPQMHVVDHSKGQPSEGETRNVLAESARIARGKIADLARLSAADHDAVIFPGGFGAAKNLSTFAVDGKDCKVDRDVERVLREFHGAGKPIGLCCIAPVLAAKVLRGVEVTVGHEQEEGGKWPHAGTAEVIKALGAKHRVAEVTRSSRGPQEQGGHHPGLHVRHGAPPRPRRPRGHGAGGAGARRPLRPWVRGSACPRPAGLLSGRPGTGRTDFSA